MTTKLVKPSAEYRESFLQAEREYEAEGKHRNASPGIPLEELEKDFGKYIERVTTEEKGAGLQEGRVPATMFWLVEGKEFIGSVSIRHKLNDYLLKFGGNIGYSIRPGKQKMGYGTKILELALPFAKSLGIDRVLITCYEDNTGSAKIIEKNGGVLENKVLNEGRVMNRYWIENK